MQKLFPKDFVSDTVIGTSNNFIIFGKAGETRTYTSYVKPTYADAENFKFWFSNTVDSTFEKGEVAFADRPGGPWRLNYAYLSDGGADPEVIPLHAAASANVTFSGERSKIVSPDEKFWSDEVSLCVPAGHYLAFTVCVTFLSESGGIPVTPDSQIPCYRAEGARISSKDRAAFTPDNLCVKPALFAAEKPGVKRLCFLGDSITQGIGTRNNGYEFWAAKIGLALKDSYAPWNLGLGFARARDAAKDGAWLAKAKTCDAAVVCLGVNDLLHESAPAAEVLSYLDRITRLLKEGGVGRLILFTLPPLADIWHLAEWREINRAIREEAIKNADAVFDMAAVLGYDEPEGYKARYSGLHPDGNGGTAVADAFLKAGLL